MNDGSKMICANMWTELSQSCAVMGSFISLFLSIKKYARPAWILSPSPVLTPSY